MVLTTILLLESEPVDPGRARSAGRRCYSVVDRPAVEGQGGGRGLIQRVGVLTGGDGVGEAGDCMHTSLKKCLL